MELFEKRVKSRFGYNIISLPMPSFEEFKQRTTELKSEEEMKRRYMVSTDPRLSLPSKIELEDLCLSETLVLACILKTRTDQMVTPQMVFREYLHTVKPQLEAMSMVRPLTIGQFCRVLYFYLIILLYRHSNRSLVRDYLWIGKKVQLGISCCGLLIWSCRAFGSKTSFKQVNHLYNVFYKIKYKYCKNYCSHTQENS